MWVVSWVMTAGAQPVSAPLWIDVDAAPPEGAEVRVSWTADGVTCALPGAARVLSSEERGVRLELGTFDHAWAGWLATQGPLGIASMSLGDCEGLPEPYAVSAPAHGTALQVRWPIASIQVGEGARAHSGPTETWLVVWPPENGSGDVAVTHPDGAPPTLFEVSLQGAAAPRVTTSVPAGGAVVLPEAATWAALRGSGVAVSSLAGRIVLIGREPGVAYGFSGSTEPSPLVVEVGTNWGAASNDPAVVVRSGRTRRMRLGRPIDDLLVADPSVAEVTVGKRTEVMAVRGLGAGSTHVVLAIGEQLQRVRLVVQ